MRFLAVFVAFASLGQLLVALAMIGPHSDVPSVASILIVGAAFAGFALARALWRRHARAARGLPAWGFGIALTVVGLVLTISSPTERSEAWPALGLGFALWAGVIGLATGHLKRQANVETGSAGSR